MAKWFGKIGYAETQEIPANSGIWKTIVIPREYFGEVVRNTRRLQAASKVNDDVVVSNEISVVADPYAIQNFHNIRYIEFMGTNWKVNTVEVQYPRLILTLGEVYNGEQA